MTHQEIIKQIVAFPLSEQFEIVEEIQRNIKLKLQKIENKKLSNEERKSIIESLDGSLKMDNPPMTRQDERRIVEDSLSEKYK